MSTILEFSDTEITPDELAILNKRHQNYADSKGENAFKNYLLYEAKVHVEAFFNDNIKEDYATKVSEVVSKVNLTVEAKPVEPKEVVDELPEIEK